MDTSPTLSSGSSPLAALPEFVEVMERGYHPIGRFSFPTAIVERAEIRRYAADCLDEIDVPIARAGWGAEGLVLDFSNQEDLSLFSLAFRGPRVR